MACCDSIFAETHVTADDLVYPLFVEEDIAEKLPIASMPGIFRVPERQLAEEVAALYREGVKAIILFGVSHHKTEEGCDSWDENGLLARMIRTAKQAAPNMVVICDNCVCEYTTHGHCGVVVNGHVDNDLTLENLAKQVIAAARAGADIVAPSSMMDGQVGYLRQSLDAAGFSGMPIMAYSTKFASSFYGPFRIAAQSSVRGDRRGYQIDPPNGREGIRESPLDEAEGADILMVKPGMPYLDILARLREKTNLPIAAYQASGEYAMIKFAAAAGAIDEKDAVRETLAAFKRAGADLVISYFAREFVRGAFDE
ncbi:porphobilinogen synthase [Sinorhizobium sp. BJ1]|uniref:porphobilinogen synthase n=1 Tax=Sinorhizobium sp. BJ1 TaxID=2035455 RepID=UPI000BE9E623|nr:porphobilinogen synthase [Sinorhizobium sp. BJ1]PDT81364.1 porphobilinogen synthase [Sinorhizobium sp. BJ1]